MTSRNRSVALLICTLVAGSALAQKSSHVSKATIDAQNAKVIKLFKNKDLKGIAASYTEDYKGTSDDGQVYDKKTAIDQLKLLLPAILKFHELKAETISFKENGKFLDVTIKNVIDVDLKTPQSKKAQRMKATEKSVETWVKSANGYLVKASKTLSAEIYIDGKLVKKAAR